MPYAPCPTLTSYIAGLKERQKQAKGRGTALLCPYHDIASFRRSAIFNFAHLLMNDCRYRNNAHVLFRLTALLRQG